MEFLPQGSKTTSVKLTWVVDSGAATIDHFDLQWREANGEWIDWVEPLERNARTVNFWAAPDQLYEFRIRAVDKDGMEEAFPAKPETSTFILPDCADDAFEGEGAGMTGARARRWCSTERRRRTTGARLAMSIGWCSRRLPAIR